ncbi:PepSY domain-containing protein [Rhodovulum sp. P5]|uniref:PepSY domain-containing protein n=1 Tax=Rhodovulum sp. P5 TaxID=1564506 RepID=UPI0020A31525|nr:PepSY domain-containing protein [Rhodovulum sp. P5]
MGIFLGVMVMSRSILPFLAMTFLALAAQADPDHDRARAALERGEILPLSEILPDVQARHGGRVIEVELERERGRYVYEFEVITRSGRILEIEVDAATGRETAESGTDTDNRIGDNDGRRSGRRGQGNGDGTGGSGGGGSGGGNGNGGGRN